MKIYFIPPFPRNSAKDQRPMSLTPSMLMVQFRTHILPAKNWSNLSKSYQIQHSSLSLASDNDRVINDNVIFCRKIILIIQNKYDKLWSIGVLFNTCFYILFGLHNLLLQLLSQLEMRKDFKLLLNYRNHWFIIILQATWLGNKCMGIFMEFQLLHDHELPFINQNLASTSLSKIHVSTLCTELFTLQWLILCSVNFTLIKKDNIHFYNCIWNI